MSRQVLQGLPGLVVEQGFDTLKMFSPTRLLRLARAAWLPALVLWLPAPAQAIERYAATPLSNSEHGSDALAVAQVGLNRYLAVGSEDRADGSTGAMVWQIAVDPSDPSGNTVVATELPAPPGWGAKAAGIAFLEGDPDQPIVVGSLIGTDQVVSRGVVWTRDEAGQFINTTLDDEATVSEARAVAVRGSTTDLRIAGRVRLKDGSWRACVWRPGEAGFARTDLRTLGGRGGEATDVAYVDDLIGWNFCGRSQRRDGRWAATVMEEEGIFYSLKSLPTPSGAESFATRLAGPVNARGDWGVLGDVTRRNGRTTAGIWINQAEVPTIWMDLGHPVTHRSSTASGLLFNGFETLVVGSAWNTASDRVATGALPFDRRGSGGPSPSHIPPYLFSSQDIEVENDETHYIFLRTESVGANETITVGGNRTEMVGQARFAGAGVPQAVFLQPTSIEIPNLLAAPGIGRRTELEVTHTWDSDLNLLNLPVPARGGRTLLEFGSGRVAPLSARRQPVSVTLVSRFTPRRGGEAVSMVLTLELYDAAARGWVDVGQFTVGPAFSRATLPIPEPARFAVAGGEQLHGRLRPVRAVGPAAAGNLEIDLLEIETEAGP